LGQRIDALPKPDGVEIAADERGRPGVLVIDPDDEDATVLGVREAGRLLG
jgi:hypothetical protein